MTSTKHRCPTWCPTHDCCTPDPLNGDAFHIVQGPRIRIGTHPTDPETLNSGLVRNDDVDGIGQTLVDLSHSECDDSVADWSTSLTADAAWKLGLQVLSYSIEADASNAAEAAERRRHLMWLLGLLGPEGLAKERTDRRGPINHAEERAINEILRVHA